jgi:hypothetical protein
MGESWTCWAPKAEWAGRAGGPVPELRTKLIIVNGLGCQGKSGRKCVGLQ